MTGLLEDRDELDESQHALRADRQLCRCTGYTPILEPAGKSTLTQHHRVEELYPSDADAAANSPGGAAQPIEVRAEWDEQQHVFMSPPNLGRGARRS